MCKFVNKLEKTLKQKVMGMYTDPKRIHPTDPGKVEGALSRYVVSWTNDTVDTRLEDPWFAIGESANHN